MDRDTVIALAREAAGGMLSYDGEGCWRLSESEVERFAALVAAHEREECAKMAEAFHRHGYDFTGDAELHEAIRSRT